MASAITFPDSWPHNLALLTRRHVSFDHTFLDTLKIHEARRARTAGRFQHQSHERGCTAKHSGGVYFSKARICLTGILPAEDYCETCRREGLVVSSDARRPSAQSVSMTVCVVNSSGIWHTVRSPHVDQSRSAGSPIVTSFLRAQQPRSSSASTELNTHMRPARYQRHSPGLPSGCQRRDPRWHCS